MAYDQGRKLDLRKMDLNLLLTLKILMETRSTSIAADRLGRTQSAVSHALNRLRGMFDDQLFVRDGWELKPTPRTVALERRLASVLGHIETLLDEPDGFDPSRSTRDFKIAAPNFCIPFFASIMSEMASSAPQVSISFEPVSAASTDLLLHNDLDAIFAPSAAKTKSNLTASKVATFQWAVFSASHGNRPKDWALDRWLAAKHIQVSVISRNSQNHSDSGRSPVDDALVRQDLTRHVALRVPDFQSAFAFAAQSDLIFTAPYSDGMAVPFGLVRSVCPIELPAIPISIYHRADMSNDSGNLWLLALVNKVFSR